MDAAVILVGGRGTRLGGAFKPGLVREGRTLLAGIVAALLDSAPSSDAPVGPLAPDAPLGRVLLQGLDAVPADVRALAVGAGCDVAAHADVATEGPLSALRAALARPCLDSADRVILLAGDLVAPSAQAFARLRAPLAAPVRLVRDADGREQYLFAAWQTDSLRAAVRALPAEARSLRALYAQRNDAEYLDLQGEVTADVDEPEDADRWRVTRP